MNLRDRRDNVNWYAPGDVVVVGYRSAKEPFKVDDETGVTTKTDGLVYGGISEHSSECQRRLKVTATDQVSNSCRGKRAERSSHLT